MATGAQGADMSDEPLFGVMIKISRVLHGLYFEADARKKAKRLSAEQDIQCAAVVRGDEDVAIYVLGVEVLPGDPFLNDAKIKTQAVKSSNIARIGRVGWSVAQDGILGATIIAEIQFKNGTTYRYASAGKSWLMLHEATVKGESVGRAFGAGLRRHPRRLTAKLHGKNFVPLD